jgi:hypothetical protein
MEIDKIHDVLARLEAEARKRDLPGAAAFLKALSARSQAAAEPTEPTPRINRLHYTLD